MKQIYAVEPLKQRIRKHRKMVAFWSVSLFWFILTLIPMTWLLLHERYHDGVMTELPDRPFYVPVFSFAEGTSQTSHMSIIVIQSLVFLLAVGEMTYMRIRDKSRPLSVKALIVRYTIYAFITLTALYAGYTVSEALNPTSGHMLYFLMRVPVWIVRNPLAAFVILMMVLSALGMIGRSVPMSREMIMLREMRQEMYVNQKRTEDILKGRWWTK